MNWFGKIILTSILGVLLCGCLKPEKFPTEPEIVFKDAIVRNDSLFLTVDFTDGDGDIGLNDSDTIAPYDTSSVFHHNFFVDYFEKVDGVGWVQGRDNFGNPITFNYRLPVITPQGQNKALKGEILVIVEPILGAGNTSFPTYYNEFSAESDTVQYRVRLADRSLNMSNEVSSYEVYPN